MKNSAQHRSCTLNSSSRLVISALAIAIVFALAALTQSAQAQTFTVLHTFTGAQDGANPYTGLIMDRAGNFYGATKFGGIGDAGVVFKITQRGSGWVFTTLHEFAGSEGRSPIGLTLGLDGNLYGATTFGGAGGSCNGVGCGAVFKLSPPATSCKSVLCPWLATVLHRFTGGADGGRPYSGVVFDGAGNLYGTTAQGGQQSGVCAETGCGVVYELTPSGGSWTQTVIYTFSGGSDGDSPFAGLIFDTAGNLYGATGYGGTGSVGTVFELTPSGSGWAKATLYDFHGGIDGAYPDGGLILGLPGNLYGTTLVGGAGNGGTVFQLSTSGGGWTHTVLYEFTDGDLYPDASLFMDSAGSLYGTTAGGADTAPYGNVFQLTPSNGTWIYSSLHEFTDGADGAHPYSAVIMDANGDLFGTASDGGSMNCASGDDSGTCGVVWEITP